MQQQAVTITENDLIDVKCENCGEDDFLSLVKLKKLTSLHPVYTHFVKQNNGSDLFPFIIYVCSGCGTPIGKNEEKTPEDTREGENAQGIILNENSA